MANYGGNSVPLYLNHSAVPNREQGWEFRSLTSTQDMQHLIITETRLNTIFSYRSHNHSLKNRVGQATLSRYGIASKVCSTLQGEAIIQALLECSLYNLLNSYIFEWIYCVLSEFSDCIFGVEKGEGNSWIANE